jgi:hypothetical protein
MTVRAKFKCISVMTQEGSRPSADGKTYEPCPALTVRFAAVYGNDPNHENRKFWSATPSGTIEMQVMNQEAAAQFKYGQEYYIDFTPAA